MTAGQTTGGGEDHLPVMPLAEMFPAFAEIGVITSHDSHQQLLTSCQLCGAAVAVDAEERHHRFHRDRNDLR